MVRVPHIYLKNRHQDDDIWVIAAGSSMNFVDNSFFRNKTVIGVNRVARFFNCTYTVSKDDRGFEEIENNANSGEIILSQWRHGNPDTVENFFNKPFFFFTHKPKPKEQPNLEDIGTDDIVVSYSTITSAMHLAAYMGAKNIILCGHDCGSIDGNITINDYYSHISPDQGNIQDYTRWVTSDIERHTLQVKNKLKEVYGCNIYSLNPFINFSLEGHEYAR